jgi:hypothetical protein
LNKNCRINNLVAITNRNSTVPSSRAPTKDHQEFREVQSTRKRIKNTKKRPRRGVTPKGNERSTRGRISSGRRPTLGKDHCEHQREEGVQFIKNCTKEKNNTKGSSRAP